MAGWFITFEGVEGSGKTTQIRMAGEFLREKGFPVVMTQEPGGTPLGDRIREILLNRGGFDISGEAEVFLFAAARAQHTDAVIRPALEKRAGHPLRPLFRRHHCLPGLWQGTSTGGRP